MNAYPLAHIACALALATLAPGAARADGPLSPARIPAAYQQECAACHLAYPPALLPSPSWARLMGGLEHHFGTDASMDERTVQDLGRWLQAHAGTYKRVSEPPPDDRITRSAWFVRKHRRIDTVVWSLPSVKSAAQCAACHTRAAEGRFDEDELRAPAGLSVRQQRAFRD